MWKILWKYRLELFYSTYCTILWLACLCKTHVSFLTHGILSVVRELSPPYPCCTVGILSMMIWVDGNLPMVFLILVREFEIFQPEVILNSNLTWFISSENASCAEIDVVTLWKWQAHFPCRNSLYRLKVICSVSNTLKPDDLAAFTKFVFLCTSFSNDF